MNRTSTIRRSQRLIAAAVLIALCGALAGCGSTTGFDPSDLLDFLDTKKRLPGERKPVFPEGVPGLEQGVPKDLYRGAQQSEVESVPPVEEPKPKRVAKPRGKSKATVTSASPKEAEPRAATAPEPDAAPDEDGSTAAAPPAPKPKKIVRRRTTAPPPDQTAQPAPSAPQPAQSTPAQQQSAAPFPAPLPSGSFSR